MTGHSSSCPASPTSQQNPPPVGSVDHTHQTHPHHNHVQGYGRQVNTRPNLRPSYSPYPPQVEVHQKFDVYCKVHVHVGSVMDLDSQSNLSSITMTLHGMVARSLRLVFGGPPQLGPSAAEQRAEGKTHVYSQHCI